MSDVALAASLTLAPRATQISRRIEPEDAAASEPGLRRRTATGAGRRIPNDQASKTLERCGAGRGEGRDPGCVACANRSPPRRRERDRQADGKVWRSADLGAPRPSDRRPRRLAAGWAPQPHLDSARRGALAAASSAGCSARRNGPVIVRPEDFRIVRYRQPRGATTIFVVDASGSSAMQRLAEVKGAIELLLADCYVRRDSVALIAFRGIGAEIVLPPTRSTARAKRRLTGLPGGGGTPLASGLDAALALADQVRRKGQSPLLVLMTDGRANVCRDGTGGRARAMEEAIDAGRRLFAAGDSGARDRHVPAVASRRGGGDRAHRRRDARAIREAAGRERSRRQRGGARLDAAFGALTDVRLELATGWPSPATARTGQIATPAVSWKREDLRWHVQRMGSGPELFMIHGTGASTHSWEGLARRCWRRRFRCDRARSAGTRLHQLEDGA